MSLQGGIEVGSQPRIKRYDLEEAPGAWVEIRRLTGGEKTERIDSSLSYVPNPTGKDDGEAHINQTKLRAYDFKTAITDHNLVHQGRKLNFSDPKDVALIDPFISDEISDLIDEHNVSLKADQERFPAGGAGQAIPSVDTGEEGTEGEEPPSSESVAGT